MRNVDREHTDMKLISEHRRETSSRQDRLVRNRFRIGSQRNVGDGGVRHAAFSHVRVRVRRVKATQLVQCARHRNTKSASSFQDRTRRALIPINGGWHHHEGKSFVSRAQFSITKPMNSCSWPTPPHPSARHQPPPCGDTPPPPQNGRAQSREFPDLLILRPLPDDRPRTHPGSR